MQLTYQVMDHLKGIADGAEGGVTIEFRRVVLSDLVAHPINKTNFMLLPIEAPTPITT
ncbi:MAG: hypothetical protein U1F13_01405 [Acinetobacter parvus]